MNSIGHASVAPTLIGSTWSFALGSLVLGPARLEIGVIAGTRSVEPWFGRWLAQASDGKVGVAETRLEGMQDWCAVPATHTFIMNHPQARQATLRFLRSGRFTPLSQAAGEGGAR